MGSSNFGFYLPGIIPYTCPKLVPFDLWCHAQLVGIFLQEDYTYLEWISGCKHSEIHSNEWSREPWYFGSKSVMYVIPTSSKPKLSCFCNRVHFDMVYFKYAIATVFIKCVSQIYCINIKIVPRLEECAIWGHLSLENWIRPRQLFLYSKPHVSVVVKCKAIKLDFVKFMNWMKKMSVQFVALYKTCRPKANLDLNSKYDIERLMQERRNSITNALEFRLSCTDTSISQCQHMLGHHQAHFNLTF